MTKALQIRHLRAESSVSDRPVVRGANERSFYDFRDRFAQVSISYRGGHLVRLAHLIGGRFRERGRRLLWHVLRHRFEDESQPWMTRETRRDLGCLLGQLEAPDRVANKNDERPIGLRARRPCVARDLRPDRRKPRVVLVDRDRAVGAEPAQLLADAFAHQFHQAAASATAPSVTSSSW